MSVGIIQIAKYSEVFIGQYLFDLLWRVELVYKHLVNFTADLTIKAAGFPVTYRV